MPRGRRVIIIIGVLFVIAASASPVVMGIGRTCHGGKNCRSNHDVAIVDLDSPAAAVEGELLRINATLVDYGSSAESVDVQLMVNGTLIESHMVRVQSLLFQTVRFTWNTTGYREGAYRIWAKALPVGGERNLDNNISSSNFLTLSDRNPQPVPTPSSSQPGLPREIVILFALAETAGGLFLLLRRRKVMPIYRTQTNHL